VKIETRIWLNNLMARFGVPALDEDQHEERSGTVADPDTLEDIVEAPLGRRRRYPGSGSFWRGRT
jgi:hypothetical protein